MRIVDIEPYIKNGWHLDRTGVANRLLESMSLADIPEIDPWRYHNLLENPYDVPDKPKNVLVRSSAYMEPIVAYRISSGWVTYGNDGGGEDTYSIIKDLDNCEVLGWWELPTFYQDWRDEE